MIACGALSPLEGFMGRDDYASVVEDMHLAGGLPWALPVCLAVDAAPQGDVVALADESGHVLATLEVDEVFEYDKDARGGAVLPHDRRRASRRRAPLRAEAARTSPAR